MQDLSSFYQGRRVLVTGHTGFKGTWLSHMLASWGAKVSGYALPPDTTPSLYHLSRTDEIVHSTLADVRDQSALTAAMRLADPELVFHLAAQPLVRKSYREPVETFATNVMGTAHVLEGARQLASLKAVVIVTSDKCYENREQIWPYRETDPMGGHDPYSASKGAAELVTAAYRASFLRERGVGVASARAGNVIGGGDFCEDRLIPDAVRAVTQGRPIVLRNPRSTRPWQHVLEPLSGYLLLGARLFQEPQSFAGGWNFGPLESEDGVPVSVVADKFVSALGRGAVEHGQTSGNEPHEATLLRLDSTQARVKLGFRAKLTLDQALAMTATWYRAHLEQPGQERAWLSRQIEEYRAI